MIGMFNVKIQQQFLLCHSIRAYYNKNKDYRCIKAANIKDRSAMMSHGAARQCSEMLAAHQKKIFSPILLFR